MIRSGGVAAWLGAFALALLSMLGAAARTEGPALQTARYEKHYESEQPHRYESKEHERRERHESDRYEKREAEDFAEYEDPYHRYLEALNENLRFTSSTSGTDPVTAQGSPEESQAQQFTFALPASLSLPQPRFQISVVDIGYESVTDMPGGTGPVGARSPPA